MAETQTWDEQGKPIATSQTWDESGKPVGGASVPTEKEAAANPPISTPKMNMEESPLAPSARQPHYLTREESNRGNTGAASGVFGATAVLNPMAAVRGGLKSLAASQVGKYGGRIAGHIVGGEEGAQTGEEWGERGGAIVGPFLGGKTLAKMPFGLGRALSSNEDYAAVQTERKLAQRASDIKAGLITPKAPVTPPTIYDEMANSAQYKDMARAAGTGEKVKKFPPPPLGPVNRMGPPEELPYKAPIPPLGKPVSRFFEAPAKKVPPPPLSGKFASRFNEPELPSKAPIPPLAGPNRNTPTELPYKAPIPPPGPVNRTGEELPSRAPIPPLGKPISRFNAPEEDGPGVVLTDAERGFGTSETPAVATSGKRPTGTESFLTNLVKKPIWTPEDMADIRNAFGQDGVMRPGEGQTQYRARLMGMIRSSRAAQGMTDIESYPAPRGRR